LITMTFISFGLVTVPFSTDLCERNEIRVGMIFVLCGEWDMWGGCEPA
jgi:hypothetical protein